MSDLKPCPFCGGVVNWCVCGNCPRITCPKCGQFDLVKAGETLEGAKQEAETTWNNRPFEQRLAEADERIAELEAAHRWIPVTERLPKPHATILAVDNSGDMGVCNFVNARFVGECFGFEAYLNDGGWDCSPSKVIGEYVTHWMPLPDAPVNGIGKGE